VPDRAPIFKNRNDEIVTKAVVTARGTGWLWLALPRADLRTLTLTDAD
jgi:hypothetical protein